MTTTPTVWLDEQQANTTDSGAGGDDQTAQKIIGLTDGTFVVLWLSNTDLGAGSQPGPQVLGQRYDAEGAKLGSEFWAASNFTSNPQGDFDAAATPDGGYVVVHEERDANGAYILFTKHLEADGIPYIFDGVASDPGADDIGGPSVSVNADGSFLVAYQSRDIDGGQGTETWGVLVTSDLDAGAPFLLIPNTMADDVGPDGHKVVTATLEDGNYVIVSRAPGADDALAMTVIDAAGGVVRAPTFLGTTASNGEVDVQPAVAALSGGGFVVAWKNTDSSDNDALFQVFDAGGGSVGPVSAVNGGGISDDNIMPDVIGLSDGGFVIVQDDNEDGTIKLQRFDSAGAPVGAEVLVTNSAEELSPSITLSDDGRLLVGWTARVQTGPGAFDNDIESKILDPRDETINGTARDETITSRIDGASVYGMDGDDLLLGQQSSDDLIGGDGLDTLQGRGGADHLFGLAGGDLLQGGNGGDFLVGYDVIAGAGDLDGDTLQGEDGDDVIEGAQGGDLIEGGHGEDTIDGGGGADLIFAATQAVPDAADAGGTIDAGAGDDTARGAGGADFIRGGDGSDTVSGAGGMDTLEGGLGSDLIQGDADVDTLYANTFSDLEGDAASSDTLRGGGGGDLMYGGGGGDVLEGGTGADTIFGFDGDDLIFAAIQTDPLNADLGGVIQGGEGADTAQGAAGQDTIQGDDGDDQVWGGGGDDSLKGGVGLDTLFGEDNDDTLKGEDGNDVLDGGAGADNVLGGFGNDVVADADGLSSDTLNGGNGVDTVDYSAFSFTDGTVLIHLGAHQASSNAGNAVDALLGFENVVGSQGGEVIVGDAAVNRLEGFDGDDTIYAIGSSDTVEGQNGDDLLYGDTGGEDIEGGDGEDTIYGVDGIDTLFGGDGDDVIDGGARGDQIFGGAGIDMVLYYGSGAGVTVNLTFGAGMGGEAQDDVFTDVENVAGSRFDDSLTGSKHENLLIGGDGEDTLDGAEKDDTLNGGLGSDVLLGGNNADRLDGGDDADTLDGNSGSDTVLGGANDDLLIGNDGDDSLQGGDGADDVNGDRGRDYLGGGDGADDLAGHENSDTLDGGLGDDTVNGGINKDYLTGGSGADIFLFKSLEDSTATQGSRDQILDFSRADLDQMDVSKLDADVTRNGNQTFLFVTAFSGAAGELRAKAIGGNVYQVQADIDGDGASDFSIDVISATRLVAGDFVL